MAKVDALDGGEDPKELLARASQLACGVASPPSRPRPGRCTPTYSVLEASSRTALLGARVPGHRRERGSVARPSLLLYPLRGLPL